MRIPTVFPHALLLGSLVLGLVAAPVRAQTADCQQEVQSVSVNGTDLHYIECGEGEPLIFVHGSLGSFQAFGPQIEPFAKEYRVLSYSRRFYPPNAGPKEGDRYAMDREVADLATLIEKLGAAPAHLVGNSYGAYVALLTAVRYPDLVQTLVLGEAPVLPLLERTKVGQAVRSSWNRRVLDPTEAAFESRSAEQALRAFLDGVLGAGTFAQFPAEMREQLVTRMAPVFRLEMLAEPAVYMPAIECETLGGLNAPVLLVTGEQSPTMLVLTNAHLERCMEGETHVMIPEAGHVMQQDNPSAFNEALRAFLQDP